PRDASLDEPPRLHALPTRRSSDLPAQGGSINLHKGGTRAKGRIFPLLRILEGQAGHGGLAHPRRSVEQHMLGEGRAQLREQGLQDWKSTRLNSSHVKISYAVFCLK